MYTYILKKGGDLLNSNQKSEYGKLLAKIIKEKNMTQSEFYTKLGIKKPYFYDIIGGKINPPPPETQLKILNILQPKENDRRKLLEIAANKRNEIPADILIFLKKNRNITNIIRNSEEYKQIVGGIINGKEKN